MKVKGIYDGTHIRLLEPLAIPPNTEVEVVVPDAGAGEAEREDLYWKRLQELGIVREPRRIPPEEDPPFTPVPITGEPIAQTIIDSRR